jgi:hypothetical protein
LTTWFKYIILTILTTSLSYIGAQKPNNIKFIVKLKSVENFGQKLENSTILIFKNGLFSDSIQSKRNKIKIRLSTGYIYKIEFTKKKYTNKHVIINSIEVPKSKSIRIKADISLFQAKSNWKIGFLKTQPVSIANYNFLKRKLEWNFDYNRSVVEKIIVATIKN